MGKTSEEKEDAKLKIILDTPVSVPKPTDITEIEIRRVILNPAHRIARVLAIAGGHSVEARIEGAEYDTEIASKLNAILAFAQASLVTEVEASV